MLYNSLKRSIPCSWGFQLWRYCLAGGKKTQQMWVTIVLLDTINDHGFEQLVHFLTRERNTLDLIITSIFPISL